MDKNIKYTVRMTQQQKEKAESLAMNMGITQIKSRGSSDEKIVPNLAELYRSLVDNASVWNKDDKLIKILNILNGKYADLSRLGSNLNTVAHTYNKMNLCYEDAGLNEYPLTVSKIEIEENKELLTKIFNEVKELRKGTQYLCQVIR